MFIAYNKHTVTLTGTALKGITCEHCKEQYVYAVQRTESGIGISPYMLADESAAATAQADANTNLQRSLQNAYEIVPCPNCGSYQAKMVAELRGTQHKWMMGVAAVGMIASLLAAFFALVSGDKMLAGILLAGLPISLGLLFYRQWLCDRYDPNAGDPKERIELARTMALLKSELPPPKAQA
jgi:hypothetical protein